LSITGISESPRLKTDLGQIESDGRIIGNALGAIQIGLRVLSTFIVILTVKENLDEQIARKLA
jgi:hypothetical protein